MYSPQPVMAAVLLPLTTYESPAPSGQLLHRLLDITPPSRRRTPQRWGRCVGPWESATHPPMRMNRGCPRLRHVLQDVGEGTGAVDLSPGESGTSPREGVKGRRRPHWKVPGRTPPLPAPSRTGSTAGCMRVEGASHLERHHAAQLEPASRSASREGCPGYRHFTTWPWCWSDTAQPAAVCLGRLGQLSAASASTPSNAAMPEGSTLLARSMASPRPPLRWKRRRVVDHPGGGESCTRLQRTTRRRRPAASSNRAASLSYSGRRARALAAPRVGAGQRLLGTLQAHFVMTT